MVCQLLKAPSTATLNRSGCSAMTASVLRPMLPVEPRMAMPRVHAHRITPEPNKPERIQGRRRRHAVDAIQQTRHVPAATCRCP